MNDEEFQVASYRFKVVRHLNLKLSTGNLKLIVLSVFYEH